MVTLYDASKNVKPATPASFGRGSIPTRRPRFVPSAADLAWAAAELNQDATDYDVVTPAPAPISGGSPEAEPDWDRLADESAALDRHERGLCC